MLPPSDGDENVQSKLLCKAGNISKLTINIECCGSKGILLTLFSAFIVTISGALKSAWI